MQVLTSSRPSSVAGTSRTYTPAPPSPAVPGLASNGQVRITYTLAQSLQSSPHSAVILESLRSKLQPLRNLHWRPSAGTLPGSSIRTVQYLEAELVPLDVGPNSARLSTAEGFSTESGRSQIPGTVLGKPFINLWLGMCDDTDTYKNVIRRQLKEWVASVTSQSKRDQEWLIVLVNVSSPGQDAAGSSGKRLFQTKGIIDRMRADFTLAKRDRCVQLNYVTGPEDPAAWTDLVAKIKDAIVTTLDGRVAERMDDVRRTEAQRAVPGWNFCTFFVLKESIAESFEGMTLLDAALIQYSELEASFYQVLKEKNLSWFGKLGGTAPGDDAAPLLSVTKKPYRDLIMSNAISVFDFRCYLLARQCLLLAKMGAIAEVASKAARFISSFARTLRENENSLNEPFLESWIYSCSLNVVDECDAWMMGASGQDFVSDAKDVTYNAAKCELLKIARAQLDKIGIRAGHLPRTVPFTTSLPDQPAKSRPTSASFDPHAAIPDPNDADYKRLSRAGVTNSSLLQAIESPEEFDELYKRIVRRAIDTCVASGRTRSAGRLREILAALHLHRGELPDAKSIYSDLPLQYVEQHWSILESYTRTQELKASESGEAQPGQEPIRQKLALLAADLSVLEESRTKNMTARIGQIFGDVVKALDELASDITVEEFSPLVVRIAGDTARLDSARDGSTLAVSVTNTLPMDPVPGLFTTAEHEYQISRLLFKQRSPETLNNSNLEKKSLSDARAVVRIPGDQRAVRLEMEMPRHVVLGDQRVLFKIHTGRNAVKSGTFSVSSQGGQIKFPLESSKLLGNEEANAFSFTSDGISVENLSADRVFVFSVPYIGAPRNDELEATLSFSYVTVSQPEVTRGVKSKGRAYVGLPLIVNINDKFRNKKLFTNVVINSASQELVRVANVALRNTSDRGKLAVKACKRAPVSVIIRPTRSAPFLFQIEVSNPNEPPAGETLQLVIAYRSLHEDVAGIIQRAVELSASEASNPRLKKQLYDTTKSALLDATTWIDMFELIRLSSTNIDIETWAQQLVEKAPVKLDVRSVVEAIEDARNIDSEFLSDDRSEDSKWKTVTMPFDVPLVNIANRVQIVPNLTPGSQTYAGQPIDITLTITSSFHWSGLGPESENECMMRYDVGCEMDSGWLVCGPKRGEYIATDEGDHKIELTLLPLRHGALSLPIVSVEPIENPESGRRPSCETWQADGAKKLTVLPRNAKSTFVVAMPIAVA